MIRIDLPEIPAWVTVESIPPALFSVRCQRCPSRWVAYHVVVVKDPTCLGRAIEQHAHCEVHP